MRRSARGGRVDAAPAGTANAAHATKKKTHAASSLAFMNISPAEASVHLLYAGRRTNRVSTHRGPGELQMRKSASNPSVSVAPDRPVQTGRVRTRANQRPEWRARSIRVHAHIREGDD